MPVSTDRSSGFPLSKWELKYLRCRYLAHRNKIAMASPAIDANPPTERPHVRYKRKKALQEERRQLQVVKENLRILDKTMNIMVSSEMPTQFSHTRPPSSLPVTVTSSSSLEVTTITGDGKKKDEKNQSSTHQTTGKTKASPYFDRPLTARLKRNTHIIFRWFIQRFGKYVPWWAEINY